MERSFQLVKFPTRKAARTIAQGMINCCARFQASLICSRKLSEVRAGECLPNKVIWPIILVTRRTKSRCTLKSRNERVSETVRELPRLNRMWIVARRKKIRRTGASLSPRTKDYFSLADGFSLDFCGRIFRSVNSVLRRARALFNRFVSDAERFGSYSRKCPLCD